MDTSRNCVITGGTSGVGLATAIQFAKRGDNVAICGRDQARLDTARAKIEAESTGVNILTFETDLTQSHSGAGFIEYCATEFSSLDVLVNNASFAPCAPIDEMADDVIDACININVRSIYSATRAAWKWMKSQQSGIIINLSSTAAVDPFPGFSLYGSTKAWIELFTVAIANEGREHNIRSYCIRPGAVETPMLRGLFADFPAEQCVSPEAVARLIDLTCHPGLSYSSGQTIKVSLQ